MSVAITCSILSVRYRWAYLNRKKTTTKEIIISQTKILSIYLIAYSIIAILAVAFQEKKEIDNLTLLQLIILWDGLFCIAVIDYQIKKIPNKILIFILLVRIIYIILSVIKNKGSFISLIAFSLFGMFIGGLIVLIVMLISRGGIGAGDMKLFALLGLYFGMPGILSIMMYALFIAAIFSAVMLISKKAKMKSTIPMAPFILVGLSVYYLFL